MTAESWTASKDHRTHRKSRAAVSTLVIGWGNELRGDDGAGRRVITRLTTCHVHGIELISTRQLTPELAFRLALFDCVIFVDAVAVCGKENTTMRRISAADIGCFGMPGMACEGGMRPGQLLALAQILYGRAPDAWLVAVPGRRFDLGESLSRLCVRCVEEAVVAVRRLCDNRYTTAPPLSFDNARRANVPEERRLYEQVFV